MTTYSESEAAEVAYQVYLEEMEGPDGEALLENAMEEARREIPSWLAEDRDGKASVLDIQLTFGWGDERDNDAIRLTLRDMHEAGEIEFDGEWARSCPGSSRG